MEAKKKTVPATENVTLEMTVEEARVLLGIVSSATGEVNTLAPRGVTDEIYYALSDVNVGGTYPKRVKTFRLEWAS